MSLEMLEEKQVEIKQVSEREISVGENRFYLGEDNILYGTVGGEVDDEVGIALVETINKLKKIVEGKMDVLIDANRASKPSQKTKERIRKNFEGEGIGKVAIFGMNPVVRVYSIFCYGYHEKGRFSFFQVKGRSSCMAERIITQRRKKENCAIYNLRKASKEVPKGLQPDGRMTELKM